MTNRHCPDIRDDCNQLFQMFDKLINNHYTELHSKQTMLLWAVGIIGVAHLAVLGLVISLLTIILRDL